MTKTYNIHARQTKSRLAEFTCLLLATVILTLCATMSSATERPFVIVGSVDGADALRLSFNKQAFVILEKGIALQDIALQISGTESLILEMERFDVISPSAKFLIGSATGSEPVAAPEVVCFRGQVAGEVGSYAYLSVTLEGRANGYVYSNGSTYYLAQRPKDDYAVLHSYAAGAELPPFVEFCGVDDLDLSKEPLGLESLGPADSPAGVRVAEIALEADQAFTNIFSEPAEAQAYLIQLLGAVSDIYQRDINVKLMASFVRTWPTGGEPFNAYDLGGFRNYWVNNEDTAGLAVVELVSGIRDLPYGGLAYVSGVCYGGGYSIVGYMNGSFPTPVGIPSNSNWDMIVMAHEMGHNFGTGHTHDSYDPLIDNCGNGTPSLGTIMSYCHIFPGYTSNIELRFHARIQTHLENDMNFADCLWFDCNNNGLDDSVDIADGTSFDINANDVPDECEDCNGNSRLDSEDISLNDSYDWNLNGIPDECEANCTGGVFPDEYAIFLGEVDDLNGNNLPDQCEPDCDDNGVADFYEIATGVADDFDRNMVPDHCQDCDDNGIPDWIDLGRPLNLYVADSDGGYVREYHRTSGVPIRNYGVGVLDQPHDVTVGPDNQLWVASFGNDLVVQIDPDNNIVTGTFSGGSELDGPSSVVFGPDGNLYVASYFTSSVVRFDATGTYLGTFVNSGSGGLANPKALIFGPGGNLFASSGDNSVIEYSGSDGSTVGTFLAASSGGLDDPRGLAFLTTGNLLVTSHNTSQVLEYDGATGAFVRVFNDENNIDQPWGVAIGPDGNVFVARGLDYYYQIYEYIPDPGRYYRSFVRRDAGLITPSGLAFRQPSPDDCDQDNIPDICDDDLGPLCCCLASRGNANGDATDQVNVSDVTYLVEHLFGVPLGPAPTCQSEANANGDPAEMVNISDITYLVDFLFGIPLGPVPPVCP